MRFVRRLAAVVAMVSLVLLAAYTAAGTQSPGVTEDRSPFDGFHFRGIGPAAVGGRIHDLAIDPKNPAVLYAAAATGGLWKSTNKGVTWTDLLASTERLGPTQYALGPVSIPAQAPVPGIDHGPPLNPTKS